MERMTERDEWGNADIIGVESDDLQINLGFEEFNLVTKALNRLAAYEDAAPLHQVQQWAKAHKEGRMVVLPAKENQPIWRIVEEESCTSDCWGEMCNYCDAGSKKTYLRVKEGRFSVKYDTVDFGKTVFLTREEAEEAMEG